MKQMDYAGQRAARGRADAWTANQAVRLGVTHEAIAAQSAAELLGPPPDRDVFGLKVVRNG